MLARRGSATPAVVDDRLPYPRVAHPCSFQTPEGDYTLAFEVCPPPPATPATPGVNTAAHLAAAAAHNNPEYPASLATCVIRFPAASTGSGSGLLGLGGSQRTGRTREASISQEAPQLPDDQASSSNSASSFDNNPNGQSMPGHSPVASRKRPLVSLPSMPSMALPGLGGSSNGNASSSANSQPSSKPKNAFRGTNSTFVKAYEGLPLSGKAEKLWQGVDPRDVTLAVFTSPRAVLIVDISPRAKTRDPIARMAFASAPTTTAINHSTLSHERLDILVGFATGDIFWIEAFSGRYTRYNKDASSISQTLSSNKNSTVVSSAPVKKVQWLQGDQLFASAFQDGCIAFWDKDREDPNAFSPVSGCAPDAGPSSTILHPALSRMSSHFDGSSDNHETNGDDTNAGRHNSRRHASGREQVEEHTDDIVVTVPQLANEKDKKAAKINPLAHWKVSRKPITDFAISPDNGHCAVVSEDGCLRIIDCNSQKLLDTFEAYFGALTCVSWSPDGRFVLTGGQDDLACVWSPFEQRIVARCEGHSSFLTGLSFDAWRCDSRTQRFASVSEDCKLILWDLSSAALQRPKGHHHAQQHVAAATRKMSTTSALSLVRKRTIESSANLPLTAGPEREAPLWHRAPNRSEVPGLQPVMVKQISSELLAGISFLPDMIVTVSRNASVKVWIRPDARH